ncbi:unnamed protein product [Lymnaea stagnalis]|uniref:G-protein coupled receptors family 1 profile domain-containing protein n=1 Tax=Lymnaea stagnalis TaxID=6523 RepID=A0AAV2I085_LYMST
MADLDYPSVDVTLATSAPPFNSGEIEMTLQMKLTLFGVGTVIQPVIIFVGFISNVVNAVIFLKMGLKDSISLCFWVLSCTDMFSLVLLFAIRYVTNFPLYLPAGVHIDSLTLVFLIVYYYLFVYDISQLITAYIAVQKCFCVALPFKFRTTFTRLRSFLVIAAISLACLALYVPIFTAQGISEAKNAQDNSTQLLFWTSSSRANIIVVVNFWGILLPTACQITVMACLVVLVGSLKESSKFRQSLLSSPDDVSVVNGRCKDNAVGAGMSQKGSADADGSRKVRKRSKEMQAVYSATFVSLIFVMCNFPRLLISYTSLVQPEFNLLRRYAGIYILLNIFRNTFEALSSSLNIFVFLKFNTRFRNTLLGCRVRG